MDACAKCGLPVVQREGFVSVTRPVRALDRTGEPPVMRRLEYHYRCFVPETTERARKDGG